MKTKTKKNKKQSYRQLKEMLRKHSRIIASLEIENYSLGERLNQEVEATAFAVSAKNEAVAEVGRIKNVLIEYFAASSNPTTAKDAGRLAELQARICNQYVTQGCFADTARLYGISKHT